MAEPPLALRWKCRHTEEQSEKVKEGEGRTSIVSTESQSLSPKENKITIGLLTHNNIEVVKRINLASFPLTFGDRFYSMIVDNRELSRLGTLKTQINYFFNCFLYIFSIGFLLAFICDIPVGAVCCRLVFPDQPDEYLSDSTVTEEADAPSQSIPSLAPPKLKQWELTTTPTTILPRSTKKLIENVRLYILSLAVLASFRRSGIGKTHNNIISLLT